MGLESGRFWVVGQFGRKVWHAETNGMGVACTKQTSEDSRPMCRALPDVRSCSSTWIEFKLLRHPLCPTHDSRRSGDDAARSKVTEHWLGVEAWDANRIDAVCHLVRLLFDARVGSIRRDGSLGVSAGTSLHTEDRKRPSLLPRRDVFPQESTAWRTYVRSWDNLPRL